MFKINFNTINCIMNKVKSKQNFLEEIKKKESTLKVKLDKVTDAVDELLENKIIVSGAK